MAAALSLKVAGSAGVLCGDPAQGGAAMTEGQLSIVLKVIPTLDDLKVIASLPASHDISSRSAFAPAA